MIKITTLALIKLSLFCALFVSLGLHQFALATHSFSMDDQTKGGEWLIEDIRSADFKAIDMISGDEGWAIITEEDEEESYLYRYNGSGWQLSQFLSGAILTDIDMVSPTDGWAVGYTLTLRGPITVPQKAIWRYRDSRWQSEELDTRDLLGKLNSIDMLSSTQGWIAGSRGPLYYDDNQKKWKIVDNLSTPLNDVELISANDVWAAGDTGVYHYDGVRWWKTDGNRIAAISMISATEGWAVTKCDPGGELGSKILHYEGAGWSESPLPDLFMCLHDITMLSSDEGWAVGGFEGVILHYDGDNWRIVPAPVEVPLLSISTVSALEGWVVGADATILHYDGNRWSDASHLRDPPSSGAGLLRDVDMVTRAKGWTVGDDFGTSDILHFDGSDWRFVTSPVSNTLWSVDMLAVDEGWAVGGEGTILQYEGEAWQAVNSPLTSSLYDLDMVSETEGWAVGGEGTILQYEDDAWQTANSPITRSLYGLDMVSKTEGWAVGENGGILRYNQNNRWQLEPGPTTDDLNDIDMISATEGWAVGDGGSILYYDGQRWQLSASPTELDLFGISMIDSQSGRIVGEKGVILTLREYDAYLPLILKKIF